MQEPINKEEWLNWLEHPVTKDYFEKLKQKREGIIETLAYSGVEGSRKDQLIGRIAAYTDLMEVSFEEE